MKNKFKTIIGLMLLLIVVTLNTLCYISKYPYSFTVLFCLELVILVSYCIVKLIRGTLLDKNIHYLGFIYILLSIITIVGDGYLF